MTDTIGSLDRAAREDIAPVLGDHFNFLLRRAFELHQLVLKPALAALDLDGPHYTVLAVLDAEGPLPQKLLAERTRVDRTTMVAVLDHLEAKRYAQRRRDTVRRRGYSVDLTPAGRRAVFQARRVFEQSQQAFLAPLTAEEQDRLRQLLQILVSTGPERHK